MADVPIESGIGYAHFAKQSAKGTMADPTGSGVGVSRVRLFESSIKPNKVVGSEEYVDGQRWASATEFVEATGGEVGDITIQAQPENGPLFFAQVLGVDTVTGAADPYTHTITSAGLSGGYGTWWGATGQSTTVKEVNWDAKIGKLTWEAGQDQKVAHQSMSLFSLKPGEVFTTAPTKAESTENPYYWTEIEGQVSLDGTTVKSVDSEVLELDTQTSVGFGDRTEALHLHEGKGTIVRTIKGIVTDDTAALYKKVIYGTASPSAGDRPSKSVVNIPIVTKYVKSATRTLEITTPKVSVKTDDMSIAPKRDGGPIEITFGGECKKDGATPALTIVALAAAATSLV